MVRKLIIVAGLTALASLSSTASAQVRQDELAIRSAASNTQVFGTAGQSMVFTISGAPNDTIETPFYSGRLGSAPNVVQVIQNSGGNCSFRFSVPFTPSWNGSVIRVFRNGQFIDGDRVSAR